MVTLSWNYYKETFLSQFMIEGRDVCILSNDSVPTYISKLFLLIYSRNLILLTMEHNFCSSRELDRDHHIISFNLKKE